MNISLLFDNGVIATVTKIRHKSRNIYLTMKQTLYF